MPKVAVSGYTKVRLLTVILLVTMPKVAVSGYTKVRLLTVIRLVTMPKVAVSGYTKVRLLTVTQPAIWFHCTISLKSLGFADCICPAKVESVIDAATIR